MNKKKQFEELLPVIITNIEKRHSSWRLSVLDWEDVSQMLIIRIWNKFHLFDCEKGPFENWVNRVISNAITNIIRDNHYKWGRPCILGCTYNLGCDNCGYTANGKQCDDCPLFATWRQKKEQQYNIKSSLSLEDHSDEVANVMTDFIDSFFDLVIINKYQALELMVKRA
jgi:DNA-directed RNA polymerase specialized sigma24 family protein